MPEHSARSDLIGGAAWIAFGLAVAALAWRMDRFDTMGATLYTMPGFVPGLIGGVVMLLGAALALRGWRRLATERAGVPTPFINARVVTMLVLSGVYAIGLVGRAPFWLGTTLFVAAFTFLFADSQRPLARRIVVAAVSAVATTVAVTLVFEQVFLVRLP